VLKRVSIPILVFVFAAGFGAGVFFSAWKLERIQQAREAPATSMPRAAEHAMDASEKIVALKKAAEASPQDVEALGRLGEAYFARNDFPEAAAVFEKALQVKPDSADLAADLGMTLRKMGKAKEAAAAFQRALEAEPGHALALFNLGLVYRDDLKDPAAALKTWETFLEKAGNAPHAVMIQPWVAQLRERLKTEKTDQK
jgi:cytochrome c-type biogenesis protein CcmH/NrfG